jgi:hypothetical protein
MKKNEIKTGVVYAYQRSRGYGAPERIVFLAAPSDGVLFSTSRASRMDADSPAFRRASDGIDKPYKSGSSWDTRRCGYPVVILTDSGAHPGALLELTVTDFAKATSAQQTGLAGAYFDVITTLGQITGLYEEKMAEYKASQKAEREQREQRYAAAEAGSRRNAAACEKLETFGIEPMPRGYECVQLSIADAEKLIALLEASNAAGA